MQCMTFRRIFAPRTSARYRDPWMCGLSQGDGVAACSEVCSMCHSLGHVVSQSLKQRETHWRNHLRFVFRQNYEKSIWEKVRHFVPIKDEHILRHRLTYLFDEEGFLVIVPKPFLSYVNVVRKLDSGDCSAHSDRCKRSKHVLKRRPYTSRANMKGLTSQNHFQYLSAQVLMCC